MQKAVEKIHFAIGESSLGPVLVAQSDKGLCALFLGKSFADLQKQFPDTILTKAEKVPSQVIAFIENPSLSLTIPLDERGTDFQRRVWKALREIPLGSTASYSDIARKIGSPKAVRAVAGACAANALAIVTPCHRVVRSDGSISGFRWGVERKRRLLQLEAYCSSDGTAR